MTSVPKVEAFITRCQQLRVLVVGDLMIDRYLWGKIERISPEAPVPVVEVVSEEQRLGGAANVALNLAALGARVEVMGLVGEDALGESLRNMLRAEGFGTSGLVAEPDRPTTVKTRILGGGQQVLRVDREAKHPLGAVAAEQLLVQYRQALPQVDAVILQDYDKGVFTPELIRQLIDAAREAGVVVTVDPKFRNFFDYAHCSVFKPNLRELAQGLGLELDALAKPAALLQAIGELRGRMPHAWTLVTLGARGMALIGPEGEPKWVLGHPRKVADVSGAGDTVLAVLTAAWAAGVTPAQAAYWANLAGGLVCEEPGVVPVPLARFLAEG